MNKHNVTRTSSSLSNQSNERSSAKSDSSDEAKTRLDTEAKKMNGRAKREEVSRMAQQVEKPESPRRTSKDSQKRTSPDSSHSDTGSTRSYTMSKNQDRSDVESIATTISQESRGSNKEANHVGRESRQSVDADDEVVLRRKPEYRDGQRTTRSKEDIQMMNLKKKTRKRTRKFEIDGVVVTTTTSKVIYGDDENGNVYDDQIFRKQELRELKMLQKDEQKQFQNLSQKAQIMKEHQEKRFEQVCLLFNKTKK